MDSSALRAFQFKGEHFQRLEYDRLDKDFGRIVKKTPAGQRSMGRHKRWVLLLYRVESKRGG